MDDVGRTKPDIFQIKNIAKIIICIAFVTFILFEMVRGFMYSDLVSGVNAIRQAEIAKDIKITKVEYVNEGKNSRLLIEGKNISIKKYWTVVAFVDLLDTANIKMKRIRVGTENLLPNEDFVIVEELNNPDIRTIKIVRLEGITKKE